MNRLNNIIMFLFCLTNPKIIVLIIGQGIKYFQKICFWNRINIEMNSNYTHQATFELISIPNTIGR